MRARVLLTPPPVRVQDDIIDNIAADGEHYARCTLTVRLGEKDALWERVQAARAAHAAADA